MICCIPKNDPFEHGAVSWVSVQHFLGDGGVGPMNSPLSFIVVVKPYPTTSFAVAVVVVAAAVFVCLFVFVAFVWFFACLLLLLLLLLGRIRRQP